MPSNYLVVYLTFRWVTEKILCTGYVADTKLRIVINQKNADGSFTPYSSLYLGNDTEDPDINPYFHIAFLKEW